MLTLRKLNASEGVDVYNMLQGIEREENGFHNEVKDMQYGAFAKWLKRNVEFAKGNDLPTGYVPQTTYWLYENDTPVGIGRIRHHLTDALRENGGNIGYGIAATFRGRGFGNEILRQLLAQCKVMGMTEVYIDTLKSNVPSNLVIRFNGGKLIRETSDKNYFIIPNENKEGTKHE